MINRIKSSGIVLSDFLEVSELDGVVGSGALGHGDTISRNGVSHVVVVNQVRKRLIFVDLLVLSILLVRNLTVNAVLNVFVFQQVR